MLRSIARTSMLCSRPLRASSIPTLTSLTRASTPRLHFASPRFSAPGGLGTSRSLNIRSSSSFPGLSSTVPIMSVEENEEVKLLVGVDDDHGGVIVEMENPMDPKIFSSSLQLSLSSWKQQGKKGIWIKLPLKLASLVQPAVEEGFWYHHAEPNYLMLVYWIPTTRHTLPVNATHRVGVGAFVFNNKRQVLAVQEKGGKLRGTGIWKFPTGVVEQGEDIYNGAIREVKEETGIDTEFVEVLSFRQSHEAFFDKSDLFFVCLLRPLSFDIQKQESEIEAAQWMPIEEFEAQPFVQKHELVKYIIEVGIAKIEKDYAGFSPVRIKSAFADQESYLYLNTRDLDKSKR